MNQTEAFFLICALYWVGRLVSELDKAKFRRIQTKYLISISDDQRNKNG